MINILRFKNNLNKIYIEKKNFNNLGLILFQSGVLFLAAAPFISFILFLISSFFGSIERSDIFLKDKYNWPLIVASILMIFNCLLITFNLIKIPGLEISLMWLGLLNWLPFFWCFWSFQKFLCTKKLRLDSGKLLIIGSSPVLISGFIQYFLGLYGPYRFFNNLIIWYQRPIDDGWGVTGLFNNQNYAGAWLCIIFPLCLGFLLKKNQNKLINYSNFFIVISFVTMIILTTSRSALLATLLSYFLLSKFNRSKIFLILFSIIGIFAAYNIISFLNIDVETISNQFLPSGIYNKITTFNLSNLGSFPRVDIWSKTLILISKNLFFGYGAGSFSKIYSSLNGTFEGIQHSHNIFLELAFNHGILISILILFPMINLLIYSYKKFLIGKRKGDLSLFDKAWIISFTSFLLIHMFDITYFDGRISLLCWIFLAGLRSMNKTEIFNQSSS